MKKYFLDFPSFQYDQPKSKTSDLYRTSDLSRSQQKHLQVGPSRVYSGILCEDRQVFLLTHIGNPDICPLSSEAHYAGSTALGLSLPSTESLKGVCLFGELSGKL